MKSPNHDFPTQLEIVQVLAVIIVSLFALGVLVAVCAAIFNFLCAICDFIIELHGMYRFYKCNKGAFQREAELKMEMEEMITRKLAYFKYEMKQEIEKCQMELTRRMTQLESKIEKSLAQKLAKSSLDFSSLESASSLPSNIKIEGLDFYKYYLERSKDESLIIAVDATPSRGGGLLYDPERKQITSYSVNWTQVFTFTSSDDSDKFEMVNALLALEIMGFEIRTRKWDASIKSLIFKTDNTFVLDGYKKSKNAKFRNLFEAFTNALSSLHSNVTMQHTNSDFDIFMKSADKLSRSETFILENISKELGVTAENRFTWNNLYVAKALTRISIRIQNIALQSGETYSFL